MAEFLLKVLEYLRGFAKILKKGGEVVDAYKVSEIREFLLRNNVSIDPTDIQFDTVVNVFQNKRTHGIQYQTVVSNAIVTMAVDMWKSELGVIFVGSQNNAMEHRCVFYCTTKIRHNPSYIPPKYDRFMLEVCRLTAHHNMEVLREMSPNATRIELHFRNRAIVADATAIASVFVKVRDLDGRVGVAIGGEGFGFIDVVLAIDPSVTFIVVTQTLDDNDFNGSPFNVGIAKMTFAEYKGEVVRYIGDDQRDTIARKWMTLSRSGDSIDILKGISIRVLEVDKKNNARFEEPTDVLPVFENITATTYTKKKLSTV